MIDFISLWDAKYYPNMEVEVGGFLQLLNLELMSCSLAP